MEGTGDRDGRLDRSAQEENLLLLVLSSLLLLLPIYACYSDF